ncbi:arginine--tRNA ligase [Roseospirillum parvum]|uniref:Arginine--tRNA ligase n=1 Tax=Roseospirillum parvum TaxID=83401 RepID=A0A1G7YIU9_9PROT|nr:arginine--tRNA ligase [Roseospirillum parvum]SDG96324.1 arginyl-tRNA synthetase [Roseospirillum parvum]
MNIFKDFQSIIHAEVEALVGRGVLPEGLDLKPITAEPPRDPAHGDVATNAALVLAKPAKMKPRDIAEALAEGLRARESVVAVEVAGPGFLNLRLKPEVWQRALAHMVAVGPAYGDSDLGGGAPVNVEYVSANPTGPMHVGHARGAVFGDALAGLLAKAGYKVTREYYINDAGAQVDSLARAFHWRYREALGKVSADQVAQALADGEIEYGGDYLVAPARALAAEAGERYADLPEAEWLGPIRTYAIEAMMAMIRDDLAVLGVRHDVFTSERGLVDSGRVGAFIEDLKSRDLIYRGILEPPKGKRPDDWEPREQTLFRATAFGDEVDRPILKSDGSYTYFASDIAYHADKFARGFATMIDVWGADHGGYVKRVAAAVEAVTGGAGQLDVKLCQLVKLLEDGQPVKMSKRAGTFVTLREVVDRVGKDVVRFIMLTRKNDATLDFDYARVTEQSKDNPVFYVQYAHARACSVLRHGAEMFGAPDDQELMAHVDRLVADEELALIRLLAGWPRLIDSAAEAHEPHRVAFYLYDLAAAFHQLWNKGRDETELRFLIAEDRPVSLARLALVKGVQVVIASGLQVFDVTPAEEMR